MIHDGLISDSAELGEGHAPALVQPWCMAIGDRRELEDEHTRILPHVVGDHLPYARRAAVALHVINIALRDRAGGGESLSSSMHSPEPALAIAATAAAPHRASAQRQVLG